MTLGPQVEAFRGPCIDRHRIRASVSFCALAVWKLFLPSNLIWWSVFLPIELGWFVYGVVNIGNFVSYF